MAISLALLTSGGSDTDAIDYATASISPTPGLLVLAAITQLDLGSALARPTVTGCGITWTFVNESGGGATEPRIQVYRAYADPALVTAGAVTFTGCVTAGQTADGAAWMIVEVSGADVLGSNQGVTQSAVASTNTDSVSATLAAFKQASDGTVGVAAGYDNAGGALDITEGSGFTMLSEVSQTAGGDTLRLGFEWKTANDTGVDATISTANDRLQMVALEIAVPTNASAGSASGTGTGNNPQAALAPSAGTGTGSGAAGGPTATVAPTPTTATGTGAAEDPSVALTPGTGVAGATGAAGGPTASVAPTSGTASGTGAASDPTSAVAPTAGTSAGTGAASDATATLGAGTGVAGATGAAGGPTSAVEPHAGTAAGSGAAQDPSAGLSAGTGVAGGTGAAGGPTSTVSPVVGTAAGVGQAFNATVTTVVVVVAFEGSVTVSADTMTVELDAATDSVGLDTLLGTVGNTTRRGRALVSSSHAGSLV